MANEKQRKLNAHLMDSVKKEGSHSPCAAKPYGSPRKQPHHANSGGTGDISIDGKSGILLISAAIPFLTITSNLDNENETLSQFERRHYSYDSHLPDLYSILIQMTRLGFAL